jgi:hypothetical protein
VAADESVEAILARLADLVAHAESLTRCGDGGTSGPKPESGSDCWSALPSS